MISISFHGRMKTFTLMVNILQVVDKCWQYNAPNNPCALQTHWPYNFDERFATSHFLPFPVKLDKKED